MPAPAPAESKVIFCAVEDAHHAAQGRAKRRADLDDRTFAPDRRSRADRQGRSEGFDHGDDSADVAALVEDRVHYFGHAVALGLRSEILHQEHDGEAAQNGRKKDPGAKGAGWVKLVGVVKEGNAMEIGKVIEEGDQPPKHGRADAGEGADAKSEQAHSPLARLLVVQARPAAGFDEVEQL